MKNKEIIFQPGSRLKSLPITMLNNGETIRDINLSTNLFRSFGWISKFPKVEKLNLNFNRIKGITKEVKSLKNLTSLSLSSNEISSIPLGVLNMNTLLELDLSFNSLSNINPSSIKLTQLRRLKLSHNNLKSDYSVFSNCPNLKTLDLSSNSIEVISGDFAHLKKLRKLNLSHNNIEHVPISLGELPKLEELNLLGNPIKNIPKEILQQGNEGILNYLKSRSKSRGIDYLYEAKMVIVGRGGTGKTSLVRKLADSSFDPLLEDTGTTEGIAISKIEFPKKLRDNDRFVFNIWDFAGQEKYDATHQFFFTDRSLYLFLTEARQESNYLDFDYWLNMINLLSKRSPIIVVQSKIDIRSKNLPSESYKNQFNNIKFFEDISSKHGYEYTIENLKKSIELTIDSLPQVGDPLPIEWVEIRTELEQDTRDYISLDNYFEVCVDKGISKDSAKLLLDYFHILGVVVHFNTDLLLNNTVIVNPDWAVDGVYAVLDSKIAQDGNGKISVSDLSQVWNEPRYIEKQPELLALMKNFGLCFQINKSHYIIPELLSANPKPHNFSTSKSSIKFSYKYEFMPAGILSRLIVKINRYIVDDVYWKYGVLVSYERSTAKIQEDYQNRIIRIVINGDHQKELLAIIRKEFKEIHSDYYNLSVSEMIPCRCNTCKDKLAPYFFEYKVLRRFEIKGKKTIPCQISTDDVLISRLITGTIYSEQDVGKEDNRFTVGGYTNNYFYNDSVTMVESIIDSNVTINQYESELIRVINEYGKSEDEKRGILSSYSELKGKGENKPALFQKIQSFLSNNSGAIGQSVTSGLILELAKLVIK